MEQGSSHVTTVAMTIGGCCFLFLIFGLLLYRYKIQRQHQTDVEYIAPYAIHVSVRRRSENASTAFNTEMNIRNHYDVPAQADPDSEYLNPMRECPYYEIDVDGWPVQITDFDERSDSFNDDDDDDVYDMAESNGTRENVTNLSTFPSKSADFANIDKINQFSGYANLPPESSALAPKNLSVRSFSESALHLLGETKNSNKVEYGEIIGTVGRHGSLTRFEPSKDIYKSIRKKK